MKNAFLFLVSVGLGVANVPAALLSPKWEATVKVVDESGQPVSGAYVMIGYYVAPPPDESVGVAKKDGVTDTNGIFRASKRSRSPDLMFTAQKQAIMMLSPVTSWDSHTIP
jgi:hypothetical protein